MDSPKLLRTRHDGNKITLQRETLSKIKQEINRLCLSTSPGVIHFVDSMLTRYPELRP